MGGQGSEEDPHASNHLRKERLAVDVEEGWAVRSQARLSALGLSAFGLSALGLGVQLAEISTEGPQVPLPLENGVGTRWVASELNGNSPVFSLDSNNKQNETHKHTNKNKKDKEKQKQRAIRDTRA